MASWLIRSAGHPVAR